MLFLGTFVFDFGASVWCVECTYPSRPILWLRRRVGWPIIAEDYDLNIFTVQIGIQFSLMEIVSWLCSGFCFIFAKLPTFLRHIYKCFNKLVHSQPKLKNVCQPLQSTFWMLFPEYFKYSENIIQNIRSIVVKEKTSFNIGGGKHMGRGDDS